MFDYVYKQRRLYFGYFGGGVDHGYKQQHTPLVAWIDNVYNPLRRLAGIWIRLGRAYLLFTSTTLYPVCQDCGGPYWCDRASSTLIVVMMRGIRVSARDCEVWVCGGGG